MLFESSVVLDGTKTTNLEILFNSVFESSVVLDGTKTKSILERIQHGLRVVLF